MANTVTAGDVEKQPGGKPKKPTGFAAHPENICRDNAQKSKGRQFQIKLRAWLEQKDGPDGETRDEKFMSYLDAIAAAGNRHSIEAIKLLWEYAHGKPLQRIEASGVDGAPLTIAYAVAPPDPNGGEK